MSCAQRVQAEAGPADIQLRRSGACDFSARPGARQITRTFNTLAGQSAASAVSLRIIMYLRIRRGENFAQRAFELATQSIRETTGIDGSGL